jgi:hypothetical protein
MKTVPTGKLFEYTRRPIFVSASVQDDVVIRDGLMGRESRDEYNIAKPFHKSGVFQQSYK